MPLPIDIKTKIHKALEATNGNRAEAAVLLGITHKQVTDFVKTDEELRARWVKGTKLEGVPNEATTINREALIPPVDTTGVIMPEPVVNEMMGRENGRLKDGLMGLGLSAEEADFADALQDFHCRHFKKSIDILGAGVTRISIKLQMRIDELLKRLHNGFGGDDALFEEQLVSNQFRDCTKLLLDSYQIANKGALTWAIIKSRSSDGAKKVSGKPGFQPLQAVVDVETEKEPT